MFITLTNSISRNVRVLIFQNARQYSNSLNFLTNCTEESFGGHCLIPPNSDELPEYEL
jgi:hypothetical protein